MKKGFASLLQKVGMLEKTVDSAFEEEREAWKAFITEANELITALRRQPESTKNAISPLSTIDIGMRDVYSETHPAYIAWQKAFVSTSSSLLIFLDEQKKEIDAANEHVSAVAALKNDISERDAKLLDVDRAHSTLEKAQQSSDQTKLAHAEEKYRSYKESYDTINAQVLQRLKESRMQRAFKFDTHIRAALASQLKFFSTASAAFRIAESLKLQQQPPPPPRPQHGGTLPTLPQQQQQTTTANQNQTQTTANDQSAATTSPPRPSKESTTTTTTTQQPMSAEERNKKLGVLVLPPVSVPTTAPPTPPSNSGNTQTATPPTPPTNQLNQLTSTTSTNSTTTASSSQPNQLNQLANSPQPPSNKAPEPPKPK